MDEWSDDTAASSSSTSVISSPPPAMVSIESANVESSSPPPEELETEADSDGYNIALHLHDLLNELNEQQQKQGKKRKKRHKHHGEGGGGGRRKLARKRSILDQRLRLLGPEERVFDQTRFKSLTRTYVPEDFIVTAQRKNVGKRTLGRTWTGRPKQYNCGICAHPKLFIFITLCLCMGLYLWDSCFLMVEPPGRPALNVASHSNQTRAGNNSARRTGRSNWTKVVESRSSSSPTYCTFKSVYLCWLFACAGIYVLIFCIYTWEFVMWCPSFGWFLFEALLCFVFSIPLLILSIAAFPLTGKPFTTTLVLIDALAGIGIGWWTYGYRNVYDPLFLLHRPGPDMDKIAQILAKRQFSKLFALGKQSSSLVVVSPESSVRPKH